MIKAGIYRHESFNQRIFCYEVLPPDTIRTWHEDMEGNHDTQDNNWWDLDITPQKFHWLVDQWNEGNVAKVYPHWWEKVDSRRTHINSLLQLSHEELEEVMNFAAFVWPHYRWTTELHLNDDLRPLWKQGKIIKEMICTRERAEIHNANEKAEKRFRADMELWGKTDSEAIADNIKFSH